MIIITYRYEMPYRCDMPHGNELGLIDIIHQRYEMHTKCEMHIDIMPLRNKMPPRYEMPIDMSYNF